MSIPACEAVSVYSVIYRIHNQLLEDLILFVFQYFSVLSITCYSYIKTVSKKNLNYLVNFH